MPSTPKLLAICGMLVLATTYVYMAQKPISLICGINSVQFPNGQAISVEIAKTELAREAGLANRSSLTPYHGMLFLFPKDGIYTFWMKDTRIPLDIVWLENQQVVEIATLMPQHGNNIPAHTPTHEADAVLEVNQGEAASLKVGDRLTWPACVADLAQ